MKHWGFGGFYNGTDKINELWNNACKMRGWKCVFEWSLLYGKRRELKCESGNKTGFSPFQKLLSNAVMSSAEVSDPIKVMSPSVH